MSILSRLSPVGRKRFWVAVGYAAFLFVFYLLGVTGQNFDAFVALFLLTALYAGAVIALKSVLGGKS